MNKIKSPEELEIEVRMKLANKHEATEWFDVYLEIVKYAIAQQVAAEPNTAGLVRERLRDRGAVYKRVRNEFAALDLKLNESFKTEGIVIDDESGVWQIPSGVFTIRMITRKESVTFRGDDSVVAAGFFSWWHAFKSTINPAGSKTSMLRGASDSSSPAN